VLQNQGLRLMKDRRRDAGFPIGGWRKTSKLQAIGRHGPSGWPRPALKPTPVHDWRLHEDAKPLEPSGAMQSRAMIRQAPCKSRTGAASRFLRSLGEPRGPCKIKKSLQLGRQEIDFRLFAPSQLETTPVVPVMLDREDCFAPIAQSSGPLPRF
jgi:hypothetical protein